MDRFWRYKVDHLLFWTATAGFHMFTKAGLIETAGMQHFMIESVIRNGLLAGIIYLNLLVLIPRFAQKGKVIQYVILVAASLAV